MHHLLNDIFSSRQVEDRYGNKMELHSNTTSGQCEFIQQIIREIGPERSLEIGLAYGISTVAILDALNGLNKPFHHIVIDPFQQDWKDIGLLNIERAGFSEKVTFYRKFSDQVLPGLYNDEYKIQFAYIDSTKVFDVLSADVYFINKILQVEGILVLDDCGFPGIRMLTRFLSQHPSYKIYKTFTEDGASKKVKFLRNAYHLLFQALPFKEKVLPNYNFKKDEDLGVNYNCIAFQKIKEDDRSWDWHQSF
jgi:predicted O-methyltransferase YrrM